MANYIFDLVDVNNLRKISHVGETILFEDYNGDSKVGTIEEIYPFTFKLSDGHSYQWKEYLAGCSLCTYTQVLKARA